MGRGALTIALALFSLGPCAGDAPLGRAYCEVKVEGPCENDGEGLDKAQSLGWFNDSTRGGPPTTSWDGCHARFKSWEVFCGSRANISVRYDAFGRRAHHEHHTPRRSHRSARPAYFTTPLAPPNATLKEKYLTLWLHQRHAWFAHRPIAPFLRAAKDAGITAVMTNLPWAWTEREREGAIDFGNYGKDWLKEVCATGLKLFVVLSMSEFPPWATRERFGDGVSEQVSGEYCRKADTLWSPSIQNATTAALISKFFEAAVAHLVATHGTCLAGISPTFNNELETRYTQTYGCGRDYSSAVLDEFRRWQFLHGGAGVAMVPPEMPFGHICRARTDGEWHAWLVFREELLARHYERLCGTVHTRGARCFLHFGEFFATTDLLNSNLFFLLADSPFVDEVIVDSNMALLGAPSSPSIVGMLVSTARAYGKVVHYEAATERVIPCNDRGELVGTHEKSREVAAQLYQQGISRALESGVDSLGFTNLCEPRLVTTLMPRGTLDELATRVPPSAVLYIPYRALYAFSFIVSGVTCNAPSLACWASGFDQLPRFGFGIHDNKNGACAQDVIQHALLEIWDDMRTRHAAIAVVGRAARLTPELLHTSSERVMVTFEGLMDDGAWSFGGGDDEYRRAQLAAAERPFLEVRIPLIEDYHPHTMACRTGHPCGEHESGKHKGKTNSRWGAH